MTMRLVLAGALSLWLAAAPARGQDEAGAGCPRGAAPRAPAHSLVLWLIPAEPVPRETEPIVDRDELERDTAGFNRLYGAGCPVSVLNTTVPRLRDQLAVLNPEFGVSNWSLIKGQRRTLAVLERFARDHDAGIAVRFVSFADAFDELRGALAADSRSRSEGALPDVAQAGSTWVGYLAHAGLLRSSLRYTTDVRLLFYWRRGPEASRRAPGCTIDDADWARILASLAACRREARTLPPMAMPIGLSANLLHDFVPLLWAGGAEPFPPSTLRSRVRLGTAEALRVPLLLAEHATGHEGEQRSDRLVAFPESTHAEATHRFFDGDYLALVEPLGFVKHWFNSFAVRAAARGETGAAAVADFWEHAGVAVPPTTFRGGSDLVVFQTGEERPLASDLARFLATDPEHTRTLAELGYLPATLGASAVEVLLSTLGERTASRIAEISALLDRALSTAREYPSLPAWPIEIESRDVLESVQHVWRRIAEGDESGEAAARVGASMVELERAINSRIDWVTRLWQLVERWWPATAAVLMLVAAGALVLSVQRARALSARAGALEELHRVRAFASAALLSVGEIHAASRGPLFHEDATPKALSKAVVLRRILDAWTRARRYTEWERGPLRRVVWRSIVLALETPRTEGLFAEWERAGAPESADFLGSRGILQPRLAVTCDEDVGVATPFLLEQALVCLVQNAVKAAKALGNGGSHEVAVGYDGENDEVFVRNPGEISDRLSDLVNRSPDLDGFKAKVVEIHEHEPPGHWPGFGLPEAYHIAAQCYGGMRIEKRDGSTRVAIRFRPGQVTTSGVARRRTFRSIVRALWPAWPRRGPELAERISIGA